jgi:hypothetical protein
MNLKIITYFICLIIIALKCDQVSSFDKSIDFLLVFIFLFKLKTNQNNKIMSKLNKNKSYWKLLNYY